MNIRRTAVAAMITAAIGLGAVAGGPADVVEAAVVSGGARIECTGTTVRAYIPAQASTRSTYSGSTLWAHAQLYRYDGASWRLVANSGWWAWTSTNQQGYAGQISQWGNWLTPQNNIANFHPFHGQPSGWYAVQTHVYDSTDRTMRAFWNQQSMADPASLTYCRI